MPHQGRSTHESAPSLKGAPPYSCFEGDPRTSTGHLLQWHAKNRHENILFTDEKILTIEEQYNNQNNKIYAQTSLEVHSEGAERPSPFLHHGLAGGVPSGVDIFIFARKG